MATMVSADFAEIAFKVTGKSNGMNHNNRCYPIERQGEITSKFIQEKYGKSKQFRWIKGRMIIPVGYVAYEYPNHFDSISYFLKSSGHSFLYLSVGDKPPSSGNNPSPLLTEWGKYLHLKYTVGYV